MSDGNNAGSGGDPNVKDLLKRIDDLNAQLTKITGERNDLAKTNSDLQGQIEGHTMATRKAQDSAQELETQLKTLQTQNAELQASKTGLEDQVGKLTNQVGELTNEKSSSQRQLALYQLIQETPDFHPLIGLVDTMRIVDDPKEQATILQKQAEHLSQVTQSAVQSFRQGSLPNQTSAQGAGGQQQPGTQQGRVPQNYEEAMQASHQASQAGQYELADRFTAMAMQFQVNGNNGQQN